MFSIDERTGLVLRYYLYMATSTVGFFVPIWVVLLEQTLGLSFTEIMVLDAVFFAVIVVAEVPTGYVGDRLGRRNALLIGALGGAAAVAALGFVDTFAALLVVFGGWGAAITLRSGNDSAWLYDALAGIGDPELFARVRGRGLAVFLVTNAATAVVGGRLFELDPAAPFVASGAMGALSAAVLLTMPESTVVDRGTTFTLAAARRALATLGHPGLRWFVAFTATFFAIGWSVDLFVQPIAVRSRVTPTGLGVLYAGLMLAAAAGSAASSAVADRVGGSRLLLGAPFALGAAFLAIGASPLAAIPAFVAMRAVLNLVQPVAETYINDRTPSLGRATVLSGWSMAFSLATIPVKLASGPAADALGPAAAVALLGGLLIVVAAVILNWRGDRVVVGTADGPTVAATAGAGE